MEACVCSLKCIAIWSLLLGVTGCSSSPADQFKPIAKQKKVQLTQLLERKQSRLLDYKAMVTEQPEVAKRSEATHIGRIEVVYAVTRPEGDRDSQGVHTAAADYLFSANEKKWVYKGCILKQTGTIPGEDKVRLVMFPDDLPIMDSHSPSH